MKRIGEHAVVIGASMAGLLAARALTEAYERVSVVDRDALPAGVQGRKAVPQGRHPHALLPHGRACLDALLPGFSAELAAAGAPTCAALEEMRFVIGGHQLARASTGARTILASRPFIEGHVRRRVRDLPQVTLIDGCDALGLTMSRHGERVSGVRILRRARRQRRGDARGRPRRRRHRARSPRPRLARGAGLPAPRGGAPRRRRDLRQPAPVSARRPARRRQVRADRGPTGPPARSVPVCPGGRSLDPRAERLRPRAPSTERPRRLRRVCRDRRSARCARGDRGRRACSTRSRRTASPPASVAATSACAASRPGCWSWATRSARSTPPTGRE